MTDKEGLILPSMRSQSLNRVAQVKISRSHLLRTQPYDTRHSWTWRRATAPKVDTNIVPPPLKTAEMKRRIAVRARFAERHEKGEPVEHVNDDYEPEPDEMSEDDEDSTDRKVPKTASELEDQNKAFLKKLCRDWGLKISGNMIKLKERLMDPNNDVHKSNRKK